MTPIFPHSSPTPKPLKTILWTLLLCTLSGHLLSLLGFPLFPFLGLSLSSVSNGFIWTLLTYPFTAAPFPSIDLLIHLAFNLILLWAFGTSLMERISQRRFFLLFFGSTLFGGLAALMGLYLWPNPSLFAGPSPVLFATITTWTILHAEETAHLGSLKFRPFWMFFLLLAINGAILAFSGNWTELIANMAAVLYGYGFCLISERVRSTISILYPIEKLVLRALDRHPLTKRFKSPKVIDFRTGEPVLNDEQFMDAMLGKISLHGEAYLTQEEKKRMQKISKEQATKKR